LRLREDENFDVRDGEHLSEMIRQASFGEVPVSMARQERDADAAKEKEHRDRIREKAKKYGVKAVGVKFSDLESRVFAMMDARNKKAVAALDGRAQKRFEAAMSESQNALSDDELDAVLADLSQQGMSPRDFWNKATATVLKMAEEARQERALDAEPPPNVDPRRPVAVGALGTNPEGVSHGAPPHRAPRECRPRAAATRAA
jgi:hypothetical protein